MFKITKQTNPIELIQKSTVKTFYSSYTSSPENDNNTNKKQLNLNNVLIFNKMTRYEFEMKKSQIKNPSLLKEKLSVNGSNFDILLAHHEHHYRSLETILDAFKKHNINTRVTQRSNYSISDINWSDAVFTAGGDGTYLLAAAKIYNSNKPVIGINTDVLHSEGYLLMPKNQSLNFNQTLEKILDGKFKYLRRSRIRIKIVGDSINPKPIELHDQVLNQREYRFLEHVEEHRLMKLLKFKSNSDKAAHNTSSHLDDFYLNKNTLPKTFLVPVRALNEVFIGESLSARVSYYNMSVDDGPLFKQKSSGIIICTGTGSTSWCYNINKMSGQSFRDLVKIINSKLPENARIAENDKFLNEILNEFNNSLVFEAGKLAMAYTIRDPIVNKIYTNEINRGFAKKIVIQSRCSDACLVIDGGVSYQFNAGVKAILELNPEDSLTTIIVNEND